MFEYKKIVLKGSHVGKTSVIPDIHSDLNNINITCGDTLSDSDKMNVGKGTIDTILPYKIQNLYTRELKDVTYNAVILENEYMKAVFLPELGGRLWSLYDKKLERDIVFNNSVCRPSNLALRNAWIAGGVEWNIGMRGHSPLTCSPMFVRHLKNKNGNDILKMYEYEEKRRVVYCIYAILDKDELVVRVEIENPYDEPAYMYWWSNIAVKQTKGTRVFAPAKKAFVTDYEEGGFVLSKKDIPVMNGVDVSRPYNGKRAVDYFYDIPADDNKWISCIEDDGIGLFQCSSPILQGRKNFIWGTNKGGRRWNDWLTNGQEYIEIQAGLLKTQFEHFLMKGNSAISWNEIYKAVRVRPDVQRGDYFKAVEEIGKYYVSAEEKDFLFDVDYESEILLNGSGKGCLEEKIRGKRLSRKCLFPDSSLTDEEEYYLDLLKGKTKDNYEISYTVNYKWAELIKEKDDPTSFDLYILGMIEYVNGNTEKAKICLEKSVNKKKEYYSLAALALIYLRILNDDKKAFELIREAASLNKTYIPLIILLGEISIQSGNYKYFIEFWQNSDKDIKEYGRIRMYVGNCYILLNDLEAAKKFINKDLTVDDIKEGEYSVSNLWISLYKKQIAADEGIDESSVTKEYVLDKYPIPYEINFGMK